MKDPQTDIIRYLEAHAWRSSREIYDGSGLDVSFATLKRMLKRLVESNFIQVEGRGKGSRYSISDSYSMVRQVDLNEYYKKEIDERRIFSSYDFELISKKLPRVQLFTSEELTRLQELQSTFQRNLATLSAAQYQQEMERLSIDLSWKSSQIEGNTYSLLETERLLREKQTAAGKTPEEAAMLLNHKRALDFILEQPDFLHPLRLSAIEDIHSLLMKDLGVRRNIRTRSVGISGTNYRPLDNEHQIKEALVDLCTLVNDKENIFEKALLLLVLLSYIQAFEDGNKRTARVVSNACLIYHNHCPISFRTIDSIEYKKAMLLFYEQHNISAFKKIFMDQFEFAVNTYF